MSSTTGQPRNQRYIRVSWQKKTKLRWPENSIEHQNAHRRRSSSSASIYIRVYTSEADFHKPEINGGRVRVWATEWDVFHCTPSRGGRGRRAAVDVVVCFGWGGLFRVFFVFLFQFFFFERARPAASTSPPCLVYLPTSKFYWFICSSLSFFSLSLHCLLCLLQYNVVFMCRGFVTTELVTLGTRIDTDTGCAGCRRVERTEVM